MRRFGTAVSVSLVLLVPACGFGTGQDTKSADSTGSEKPVVGVILPDRTTSARWEEQDRPLLSRALRYAGIEPLIQNAEGDEAKFAGIAEEMIKRQVKVLMITPLTPESGAAVERKAKAAGVPVIDYDRISLGGVADYYVSFDNVNVGELQADGLITCVGDKPGARIVEIEGAPTDNNATLFLEGQRRKLGPKYDSGAYRLVKSQAIDKWSNEAGGQTFEQILNDNGGKVDGVVAANDGLAGAVIDVLRKRNLAGTVPVTGQDATLQGLQAVLRGEQCMTVYKPIRDEAEAAARLAIAVAKGDRSGADDLATGNTRDQASRRDVKSLLLGARLIMKSNMRSLVAESVVKSSELCVGDLVPLCAQNDITMS
jgi:D-xylose transport system substrate-binding protein